MIIESNSKIIGEMMSPERMKELLPLSPEKRKVVDDSRERIRKIFSGESDRKILIIGPCSIDYEDAFFEYGEFIKTINENVKDKIEIILRFYPGKPRTVGGWKGLAYSAPGDDANLGNGIFTVRSMALRALDLGLPLADEMLNPHFVKYVDDYLSYIAIGARSTENQYHREVASGLDVPVGFKNPTSGNIEIMSNSIKAGQTPSHYAMLGSKTNKYLKGLLDIFGDENILRSLLIKYNLISKTTVNVIDTNGNPLSHGLLRGGSYTGPNYSLKFIEEYLNYADNIKNSSLIIDTSHDNSRVDANTKDPNKQIEVMEEVFDNIIPNLSKKIRGSQLIKGIMVESYLYDGSQKYIDEEHVLKGKSLTDPCIGKEKTKELIMGMYNKI